MTNTARITRRIALGLAIACLLAPAGLAAGEDYPARPVRIVVPYGAGGIADVTMRLTARKMSERLGQQFIIDNRPGGGGVAGMKAVATSPPDGYTLSMIGGGLTIAKSLFKSLPYDLEKDFVPISTTAAYGLLVATKPSSSLKSVQDILAAARRDPGKLNFGTINPGSAQHLSAELFRTLARIDVNIGRRNDRFEMNAEPVREPQNLPRMQIRLYELLIHRRLSLIRSEHVNPVRTLGSFIRSHHHHAVGSRLLCAGPRRIKPHNHLVSAIAQILRLRVSLAAVAQDGNGFGLQGLRISVMLIKNGSHQRSPLVHKGRKQSPCLLGMCAHGAPEAHEGPKRTANRPVGRLPERLLVFGKGCQGISVVRCGSWISVVPRRPRPGGDSSALA